MFQLCDFFINYDGEAGWHTGLRCDNIYVKVHKNDPFRQGHQPRVGVPCDHWQRLDLVKQLLPSSNLWEMSHVLDAPSMRK